MKNNTKIEIEIQDNETWTTSSLEYPWWFASGAEEHGCADIAAKDLERRIEIHK